MTTTDKISDPTRYDLQHNESPTGTLVFYDDWAELKQRAEQAESRAASNERDAKRYRYMRETGVTMRDIDRLENILSERLDKAIDAAITASEGKDG